MIYKPFQNVSLSTLGMGNMRLPTNDKGTIDRQKAKEIIEYAYHNGVNYFDVAYRYHGGEAESFVGEVLSEFSRDSFYLASKMPGHMMNYIDGKLGFQGYLSDFHVDSISEIFEEQLQKCRVEYFDFYLLHNVCETSYDFYTNEELGVVRYLLEQKKAGRIKHLGFSSHGRPETIERFLDHYPGIFEFVQIQLNYLDWSLQDAGKKYELLTKRNIPVIVMEPVRGGALANLPEKSAAMLKEARPESSLASWAFRFLQSLPNVLVVLSGMTTLEQLKENIDIFSKDDAATKEETALLFKAANAMGDFVPCTGCRYCVEDCPQHLDIPKLITMYNELTFSGKSTLNFTVGGMKEEELPSACIACGACQRVCPQGLPIPEIMSKFADGLK